MINANRARQICEAKETIENAPSVNSKNIEQARAKQLLDRISGLIDDAVKIKNYQVTTEFERDAPIHSVVEYLTKKGYDVRIEDYTMIVLWG